MKTASNQLLVIFGASGDLTGRKLLPSLYEPRFRKGAYPGIPEEQGGGRC